MSNELQQLIHTNAMNAMEMGRRVEQARILLIIRAMRAPLKKRALIKAILKELEQN